MYITSNTFANTVCNITPEQAAEAYMSWMQPYASRAPLGAGGSPEGLTWLAEFMGNCTECTIDFIPFHWFDSASNYWYFKAYIQEIYAEFGKPLWITEFNGYGSLDDQVSFLELVMPWLDSIDYVERYAWLSDSVGYLLDSDVELNEVGVAFMNYTSTEVDSYFNT